MGILSYVHVFKKEIGVINSPICGFYSLRRYTSNLVKITPVVSEAENTKNGRKQIAIVYLSDLVDFKTGS